MKLPVKRVVRPGEKLSLGLTPVGFHIGPLLIDVLIGAVRFVQKDLQSKLPKHIFDVCFVDVFLFFHFGVVFY